MAIQEPLPRRGGAGFAVGERTGVRLGTEQAGRDRGRGRRRRRLRPDGADDAGRDPEEQSDEAADDRVAQGRRVRRRSADLHEVGQGDPNKVLLAYSLIYMLPLSAKIPFNWRELTPVAVTALDQFVLWDNTTMAAKNVKEFVDAAKAASPPFKMGGTGSKREDQVLTVFMEKKTGAKFLYLPYKSGGEAATQLVGNHTAGERQQSVGEPRSLARQAGPGALRVRQGAHRLQDQGHRHAVVERHSDLQGGRARRAVFDAAGVLPAGQSHAGAAGVLRRSVEEGVADRRVQGVLEKQALKGIFLEGKDMLKFLEEDDKLNTQLMTEAGFVAK